MPYSALINVPQQTAGVSAVLASHWNDYVKDNFELLRYGHLVFATAQARNQGVTDSPTGMMVYLLDTNTLSVLDSNGSWREAVNTASIVDLAVTTGKINALAVTTAKIDDNAVTSAKILDGTIVNADINASAAIAYSKLNLTNSIVSGDIVDGTIAVGDLAAAVAERLVPVGTIQIYSGTTAPTGWLLCNGDTVPNGTGTVQSVTANYAALYTVLSTTYGGAGKLPDMQGRMPIGKSGSYTIGSTGGAATAALGVNNLPAHTHSVSEISTGGTAYASIVNNTNFDAGGGTAQRAIVNTSQADGLGGYEGSNSFGTSPNHTHSVSVSGGGNGTGTGNPFNTISPYVAVNYIIKY